MSFKGEKEWTMLRWDVYNEYQRWWQVRSLIIAAHYEIVTTEKLK